MEAIRNNLLDQVAILDHDADIPDYLMMFIETAEMAEVLSRHNLTQHLTHYINHDKISVVRQLLPLPEDWLHEHGFLLRFQGQEMVDLVQFPANPWHFSHPTFQHHLALTMSDQDLVQKHNKTANAILQTRQLRSQWLQLWISGQRQNADALLFKLPSSPIRQIILLIC